MTQERFQRLLDNPELLASISYEELKTLALAYPYSHNLRYLLAFKARQDDLPDAERALAAAAAYSLDRKQLFLLAAPKELVPRRASLVFEEAAVLELKPIEAVQRELEALAPQPKAEKSKKAKAREAPPGPAAVLPTDVNAVPEVEREIKQEETETIDIEEHIKFSLYQPFAVWISRFNPPVLDVERQEPPGAPVKTEENVHSPTLSAQELAEKSVSENKDVISETLARLLAKQGYREKAIAMYERLCLAIPEKSGYFASEIEKLKK